MIVTLKGEVTEKFANTIVLDVGGVGYGLLVTIHDASRLNIKEPTMMYIYEHIRENIYDLYGFCNIETKLLFEQLINVNGVGPRMALNLLSIGNPDELRGAIANGEVKFIQSANGVGKKVAERVIVELKDKVGLEGVDLSSTGLLQPEAIAQKDEAVSALMALGYSSGDAIFALQNVDKDLSIEDRVRIALKGKSK